MNTLEPAGLEAACSAYNASEMGSDVDHVRKIVAAYLNATRTDTVKATDAQGVAWFEAELSAISAAIGSVRFMDPPDGGSVTLAEQVGRMREALNSAEAQIRDLKPIIKALIAQEYNVETWGLKSRLAAIDAALSALDVPAHPEGVKDDAKRSIVELVEMHKRLLIALEVRGRGEFVDYERYYHDWSNTVLNAMTVIGNLSSLSHPEPVAQEAVDRLWDRPIMELAMAKAGHSFDVTAKRGKIRETREAYIASNWSHWREDAIVEVAALSALAHPSPSPEQGEDDLVQRLFQCAEVLDAAAKMTGGTDRHYRSAACREAATAISTLRVRVAELEASATPQAGASEAEPVAWMRDYPDMTCLTTTKPEPPEPGWRDIWMPLYATPPDSDAVRADAERLSVALLKVRTLLDVEYHDDGRIASVGHASSGLREMVHILDDTLSNQGSSSNGQ